MFLDRHSLQPLYHEHECADDGDKVNKSNSTDHDAQYLVCLRSIVDLFDDR